MELRLNTTGAIAAAGLIVAVGVWATAFGGWRTDVLRRLLVETPGADKIGHVVLYAALALLVGLVFERIALRVAWVIGPIAAWAVGFADELRQAGIRGRAAGVDDLLANTAGVLIVAAVLYRRCFLFGPKRRADGERVVLGAHNQQD